MSEISMKGITMTKMLDAMHNMELQASQPTMEETEKPQVSFSSLLERAIDQVNDLQQTSEGIKNSYELGDRNTSLAQVMIASQKANLSFQALLQVRNKLVSAYKEIMNMPV